MIGAKDNRPPVKEGDVQDLKNRMKVKAEDDTTHHNEFSFRRYLKAFRTPGEAQAAILETNQWRSEMKIAELSPDHPDIKWFCDSDKARFSDNKDAAGRPIIYISAKNYSNDDRKMKQFTQFVAYCLEEAGKRCFEEVIDNFCIIFDLKNINLDCVDYQIIKLLAWELSRYYPERLGVCIFWKAPMLFKPTWSRIEKWLDKHTLDKVFFVNSEEELAKFLQPDLLKELQEDSSISSR